MATRALLLCGDDKAVHVVTQILDELEISFEHSPEPPFALKRLAVRRFELLIVDCDNVQNATQVFNSARASNLNKASIAIAIVEGKAGVPSAFRLGASLVLTKPVSLDQARNTLRTGLGMTRKDQEVKPAVPAVPAIPPMPPMPTITVTPASVVAAPVVKPMPAILTPLAPVPVAPTPVAKAPVTPAIPVPPVFAPIASVPAPIIPKAPEVASKDAGIEIPATEKPEKPEFAPAPVVEKAILTTRPVTAPVSSEEYKPALTNFIDEISAPTPEKTVVAKAAAAAAGAVPAETSKFDSVFASPGVGSAETKSKIASGKADLSETAPKAKSENKSETKADTKSKIENKIETKIETKPEAKTESKKDGKVEEKDAPTLRIEDPLAEEDSVLDPIRDNGVPSFGTTANQSFAGLEKQNRGKGLLVAALVLVVIAGGSYAAWITQPAFREIATYEYGEMNARIAGHPQPQAETIAAPNSLPAPPPPASLQGPATLATDAAALPTTPATGASILNSNPAASAPAPAGKSPALADATSSANTQKSASVQTAKQDTSTGHGTANPAVIAAAANLPSSGNVGKSSASDLIEVPEDFADDQVVHRVHPTYPKQARTKKLQGTVVLQAVINKQGKVDSLQLVSGDPQLAQAAAEAVKQWRYKPYSRNGEPADFQTKVSVDFKLP